MTKRKSTKHTTARASTLAMDRTGKVRVRDVTAEPSQITSAEASRAPRPTKQALVIGLLQRPEVQASPSSWRPRVGCPTRPGQL